jgi:hypothetical protein
MAEQSSTSLFLPNTWKFLSQVLDFVWRHQFIVIGTACSSLYLMFIVLGFDQVLFFDEQEYLTIARNLIASGVYGYGLGVPSAARPPGYIVFILPIVALGLGKPGIVFVQVLLWGASVYLCGLIACQLRGSKAGALAILFAISYPLCSFATLTVYPQILTALLVLLFVWFLLKDCWSTRDAISIGAITGLTILVSPILLPLFLGALFLLPFFSPPFFSFRKFRPAIIAVLVACCFVAPWIGRNWTVMGTTSISTIVGFNLLYGNSENAAPELGTAANIDKYGEAVRGLNEVETDRAYRNFALKWMSENPTAAIKLYVGKLVQFFAYREVLRTQVAGAELLQFIVAAAYYPLLLLSFIGAIYFAAARSSRGEITMCLLYLASAAVHAVFLQRLRYRVEVDFLLVIVAASFLATMFPAEAEDETALALPSREPTAIPTGTSQ